MTAEPGTRGAPERKGLLEKLVAAVRAEFRADIYFPDPDDPVLGCGMCPVPGCDRPVAENGLCSGHGPRWDRC